MSIYEDMVSAGVEIDSYESDLYCKVNDTSSQIINKYIPAYSVFRSQLDGQLWFDIPFAYDPFWERRAKKD